MSIKELIKFFRQSVLVQDPEVVSVDEDFLSMTDEDFIPLLTIALSKVDPSDNINHLSNENLYALVLVAKKELFYRLAMKTATKYSLTSATGVQLKRAEIFDHYYKLIEEVEKEYKSYLATGVPVKQGEILLSSRYFSARNYSLATAPTITGNLDNVYSNKVEVSWSLGNINKFAKCEIYLDTKDIVDRYKNNAISPTAKKVVIIRDVHCDCTRIENLKPDTEYHLLFVVEERNGLKGVHEITFTTLEEEVI